VFRTAEMASFASARRSSQSAGNARSEIIVQKYTI
jgi:hypothetical protein